MCSQPTRLSSWIAGTAPCEGKLVERVRAVEVEEAGINDCARNMTCEDEERAGAGSAP